mgnify:CR=1 FL=1
MIKHMNPHGHHIGGLTGFLKSIGYAIRTIKPTRVILVFDGLGGSTAKRLLYPDYKGNRKLTRVTNWEGFETKEEESEAITNQIVRLIEYLKCLPVDLLMVDKVEADDVIGYLSKALEEVCVQTVESGIMTKDLAVCVHGNKVKHGEHYVYTEEFLDALDANLQAKLA